MFQINRLRTCYITHLFI